MGKKLIIAEKPSVAGDIARVLGGFKKHDDYFESDEYVLSSAIGHLLELTAPDEYEVKRGKWSFANLPVIPPHFDLKPIEKTEARLRLLMKLLKRKDVDGVINACDAGREGELIFRYIMRHAKVKKPIQRLWLQSMTPGAISEGFERLRADRELLPLADAAMCRSESDWLVGINGTRAMTAFNSKSGGFHKTPVGRVQTPTLAILVEREEKIKRFVSRDYWEVHARFGVAAGEYEARWFDEKFTKGSRDEDSDTRAERIWDEKRATAIRERCAKTPGEITEESKPSTQLSPLLFDLTSLQRTANGRFGFSARMTLSVAQALYERHKVLTYPRTDSRCLPEDYPATVKETLQALAGGASGKGKSLEHPYAPYARKVLAQKWVRPNKRIFNNAKVSDHFRDHSDGARAEASERSRNQALRSRRAPLPLRVLSGRGIPDNDAHHARRRRAFQERRQGSQAGRLAGSAWQRSAGRRRSQPRAGHRGRAREDDRGQRRREPDEAAGTFHGSDPAHRNGRRRQARRGRGAARRDERARSRHTRDARGHHRKAHCRRVRSA